MCDDAASARSSSIDIICVDSCAEVSSTGSGACGACGADACCGPWGVPTVAPCSPPPSAVASRPDAPALAASAWSRKICVVSDGSSAACG